MSKKSKQFTEIADSLGAGYHEGLDSLIALHISTLKRQKSLERQLKRDGLYLDRFDSKGRKTQILNPLNREITKLSKTLTGQLRDLRLAATKQQKMVGKDNDYETCEECHAEIEPFHVCGDLYALRSKLAEYEYRNEGKDKDGFPKMVLRSTKTGKRCDDYLLPKDHPEYATVSDEEIQHWRNLDAGQN